MSQAAEKFLTFDDLIAANTDGRYELVDGRLEELVSPRPSHSWSELQIAMLVGRYLDAHEPGAFYGVELDIPTLPHFGRRPDFAYHSAEQARRGIDRERDLVTGSPTLVVEVVSPGDQERDTVIKPAEYARTGIPHYWIFDPANSTATLLELKGRTCEMVGEFHRDETVTTSLFPGLEIPLTKVFR